MSELEQLLNIVEAIDPDKRAKEEQPPTDEELSEARKELTQALKDAAGGERPDLEAARAIRSAIDAIDAETVTRSEQREAERAEAAKLLEGLEEVKAEQDDEAEGDGEDKQDDEGGEGEPTDAEAKKEPVAASLSEAIKRSSKRRVERVKEERQIPQSDVIVSSVGLAQGFGLSQDASIDDVARMFNKYAPQVKRGSQVLLHMDRIFPEDRALGLSAEENTRRIDQVMSPRAITAAGGICEPLPADFTHPICGERGRPITNSLPSFRADRGGIRFAPAATVADLESAITVWTHETDTTPGSDTKACPRLTCDEEDSAQVDAVVACLTVGNFQARFNPEFWRSRLDLLMVAHDRVAEQTAYATIESSSTQLTAFTGSTGTTTDVLQAIDRAVAGIESRHRYLEEARFSVILPQWLQDALRSDLAGQLPAGSTDLFAVADAMLSNFFSSRGVTPVWSPDVDTTTFQTQGAGGLVDFPGTVKMVLYPEGTWMFLDGGTLDLGTQIVDSTLNATNDRQAFLETFEQVVQRGCESLSIEVNVGDGCICQGSIS